MKNREQLEFIKRVREFLDTHTAEQIDKLPKDKNGFIDFHTIFKQQDKHLSICFTTFGVGFFLFSNISFIK